MRPDPPSALLDRVRKLLAKAEAEGVTPPEAEALTAKAAELMARYGIDRARLAASRPETDRPGSRVIDIANPWAQVRAHLLAGLAGAMRCQCVLLSTTKPGARIHVFGYASDLERTDILYTSLLLQMARGLAVAVVPPGVRSVRAWRRSWLLGFVTAVITRVKAAEDRAASSAEAEPQAGDLGEDGGRVKNRDVVPGLGHGGNDVAGLGQVRGAGHVGHHAAGPDRVQGGAEQLALQAGEVLQVAGGLAPPGFGAAAQ